MGNVTSGVLEISIPCFLSWDLLEEANSDGTDSWGVHWICGQRGQMSWMRHFQDTRNGWNVQDILGSIGSSEVIFDHLAAVLTCQL